MLTIYRWCAHCPVPFEVKTNEIICPRCRRAGHKGCTKPPPVSVDPERQARILTYRDRASARRPVTPTRTVN